MIHIFILLSQLLELNGEMDSKLFHSTVGLRFSIPKILYWVVYTVPYLDYQLATTRKKKISFKLEIYSDRADCFGSLGR